jgi:predicted MFS family arabinose efflux permease
VPLLLLSPVAGVIADRWDRRRIMISADLFRAAAVCLLLLAGRPQTYWIAYLALAAESTGSAAFTPAMRARLPAIVGTGQDLTSAASLTAASSGVVQLIGGPLGGLLLAFSGITTLIIADVASYLISAVALLMTARQPDTGKSRAAASMRADLRQGLAALRAEPTARGLLLVSMLFLGANASLSALFIPFAIIRLGGTRQAGFLLFGLGAGYLLGAPLIRAALARFRPRYLLPVCLAGVAIAFVLLFHSSSLAEAVPAVAAVGVPGSMTLACVQTTLQRVIPNDVLGRISAVFVVAEAAVTLAGSGAGPALATLVGLPGVSVIAGLLTLGSAALAFALLPA